MPGFAKRAQLSPQQWFEIINQLWFDGDKEGAVAAAKRFRAAYPDYPVDQLKKDLPQGMDLSVITGDMDEITEDTKNAETIRSLAP